MKEGRPDYHPRDTFPKKRLLSCGVAASALVAFGATAYCLSAGIFVVCSHLFYVPVVLASYRYPARGVALAGMLAAAYLAGVLLLFPGGGVEVANAILRVGMLLAVAAVVSHLSVSLQARESRYRGLFETSGMSILLFSPGTGKVEEMNRQCATMLGCPASEVPLLQIAAIWPGYPSCAETLERAGIEGLDCELVRRDGTPCPVLLSASLLPDRQAGCVMFTGTAERKRMENRLRRLEETYRVILNTTDVGIVLTSPGRRIVTVNKAAIRLFGGAGLEDLVGRNPEDLIVERSREAVRAYRERVLRGETPLPLECILCGLDGAEWPAEISVTHLAKDGDAPERLILSIRDITERRRAEEAMREENRRLSIVNEVVAAATASRRLDDLLRVSLAKTVALLGFDLGAIYLMRPGSDTAVLRACEGENCNPPTVRRDESPYRDVFVDGEARFIDRVREKYPGHEGLAVRSFAVVPIPGDGGPVGCIAVMSRARETVPESERRILLAIGEGLASEVVKGMLQEDLEVALASTNRYLDEAHAAATEVNLYVDILTHDINNANTAAMGYLQMYLESLDGSDGVLVEKSLAAVYQSNNIIRNVSTIRRLKSWSVELGPVRLEPVIRGVCNYYADACINYAGPDATVLADDLISEVFVNLIGNAVKFGGPAVEVTVSVREEGGDTVAVTVADTGPGVPDDLKPHLFQRYQRGVTKMSGKGLGLYIVWTLVERYGGSVRAGDRVPGHPEEGAAVTFTLPCCRPPAADE